MLCLPARFTFSIVCVPHREDTQKLLLECEGKEVPHIKCVELFERDTTRLWRGATLFPCISNLPDSGPDT